MQPAVRITLTTTYTGGPFFSGVASLTTGSAASGWSRDYIVSIGSVGERVDIATGGNYAQLLDCDIILSHHDGWMDSMDAGNVATIGALVDVGTISGTTFSPRWSGTVIDALLDGGGVNLRCESILSKRHRTIPARILTRSEFPALPAATDGKPVPILYGAVERLDGPVVLSDKDWLCPFSIRDANGDFALSATYLVSSPASTTSVLYLALAVYPSGGEPYLPGYKNSDLPLSYYVEWSGGNHSIYVSVVDGTGSGQDRLISSFPGYSLASSADGLLTLYAIVNLSAPLDTALDSTSRIAVYSLPNSAGVVAGDECVVSSVETDEAGRTFPMTFTQSVLASGITTADVSGEFRNGEDYAALSYVRPFDVRGVEVLRDGLTASGGTAVSVLPQSSAVDMDAACWGEFDVPALARIAGRDGAQIFAFVSASTTGADLKLWAAAILWDGSIEYVLTSTSLGTTRNNYPASIFPDGTPGEFGVYPLELPLSRALESYRKIRLAVWITGGTPTVYTSSNPVVWSAGASKVNVYGPEFGGIPSPGIKIRPSRRSVIDGDILAAGKYGGNPYEWRTVTGVVAAGGPDFYDLEFASPWDGASGSFTTVGATAGSFLSVTQTEIGIAAMFGSIQQGATFLINTSSGRTYSDAWPALPSGKAIGDPIMLARDAVLDMYYRDLRLATGDVDFDAFQALPDDAIRSCLVERVESAQRVADLCQQFGWIVSHDLTGRETAAAWLQRVSTTDYDYSIDTSDIVDGSISGRDVTDIIDLVNLPLLSWDWTPADGFRQSASVVSTSLDPADLDADNYLAVAPGFGDFAMADEVYRIMRASAQANGIQRAASFEFPDFAGGIDPLINVSSGMDRMTWISTRKHVLRFSLPETYSAGWPTVGKRAKVRHKRFTANEWVYGTIVESLWSPMSGDAKYDVTVMLDPTSTTPTMWIDILDDAAVEVNDMLDNAAQDVADSLEG